MNTMKETFVNETCNEYREKFHSCLKSWKMGAITGVLVAAALSFLFSGFHLDSTFFILLPFMAVASTQFLAALFAMRYTEDFGLSCIPRGIMAVGNAGCDLFAGTYVLTWFAYLLIGMSVLGWLVGMLLFSFLFPLETVYYGIRSALAGNRPIKEMA
jgi:MFS family permease